MRSEFYHSTIEVNDYPEDKIYVKNAEQLDEFIKTFNKTTDLNEKYTISKYFPDKLFQTCRICGKKIIYKNFKINRSSNYMNINFEEIESIEKIENFNDYVYDIEVDDNSHTFIANNMLVHNSVYTTYENFFKCFTPEYLAKYPTVEDKINWILKFNKEFLDKQNNKWCEKMYNPRHGQNVHEFELETVCESQIILKKKKYLKGLRYNKGKFLDKPKMSGTGIEIIKSTTPKLCREILTDLTKILMFEFTEDNKDEFIIMFNDKLSEYRKQFYKAPIEDISQSVGVGAYKKYVIEDEDQLILGKQCPVSVQAIARFNHLAHKNGEDDKRIYSGKIKYYNIVLGRQGKNPVIGYFGFPAGEIPSWAPKMDKQTQWKKNVIDPINRFLEVMDIPLATASEFIQLTLF